MADNIITFTLDKQSQQLLEEAKEKLGKEHLFNVISRYFESRAQDAVNYVVRNQVNSGLFKTQARELSASLQGEGKRYNGVPGLRIGVYRGPAVQYAGVQEMGTSDKNPDSPYPPIRPVTARALAVPIEDPNNPATQQRYRSPRQFPGKLTFIPYPHGGNVVGALFDETTVKRLNQRGILGSLSAIYLLMRQVSLEPRPYLERGLEGFLPELISGLETFLSNLLDT